MNKVLLVGRLVRDPEIQVTNSNIKYARFTVAVSRQFGEDKADFIPIVAWRSQAEFLERYVKKGARVSIEGRFNSSSYKNKDDQTITRYEVSSDRVQLLETKTESNARGNNNYSKPQSVVSTQVMQFEAENKPESNTENKEEKIDDVPWELDL